LRWIHLPKAISAVVVVINVIEALRPSIIAVTLDFNDPETEAAPKAGVTAASNATLLQLLIDELGVLDIVLLGEVVLEGLATMTHFATISCAFADLFIAFPCL